MKFQTTSTMFHIATVYIIHIPKTLPFPQHSTHRTATRQQKPAWLDVTFFTVIRTNDIKRPHYFWLLFIGLHFWSCCRFCRVPGDWSCRRIFYRPAVTKPTVSKDSININDHSNNQPQIQKYLITNKNTKQITHIYIIMKSCFYA